MQSINSVSFTSNNTDNKIYWMSGLINRKIYKFYLMQDTNIRLATVVSNREVLRYPSWINNNFYSLKI